MYTFKGSLARGPRARVRTVATPVRGGGYTGSGFSGGGGEKPTLIDFYCRASGVTRRFAGAVPVPPPRASFHIYRSYIYPLRSPVEHIYIVKATSGAKPGQEQRKQDFTHFFNVIWTHSAASYALLSPELKWTCLRTSSTLTTVPSASYAGHLRK